MTKKEKAAFILKTLKKMYPNPAIPLAHDDSYTFLIAVLLSAQCTDKRVNMITPLLWKRARTPDAMGQLAVEDIEAIIRPCGLAPRKAKAIRDLSRILVEKHGGQVPGSFRELEALPGVGHKTASVVMSHVFHVPAFPVDTHIHRLAERWGLSSGKSVEQSERDLKKIFPEKEWNTLHLRLIYYGREHCPARNHKLENCPICSAISRVRR